MFTSEEQIDFGDDIVYDETPEDVILPKTVSPCKILVKMIGELQADLAKNKSNIYIPTALKQKSSAGSVVCEILQIGSQCFKSGRFIYMHGEGWENEYKVGDKVLIKRYSGNIIPGSKGTFQIIDDDALCANYN
jgi:co-chaperonin GroES (HSP10)